MSTTVLRVEKIKNTANIRSSGAHIFRLNKETLNADPSLKKYNYQLFGNSNNLAAQVQKKLDTLTKPVRKNAVLAMDGLLSLSPEIFGKNNKRNLNIFAYKSRDFLIKKFGNNLVNATLHLDETTPHIHFTVVPIDKDKTGGLKLNARDLFNKESLSMLQKEYFKQMQQYIPELKAPNYGSKAKHTEIKQFYAQIEQIKVNIKKEASLILDEFKNDDLRAFNNSINTNIQIKTEIFREMIKEGFKSVLTDDVISKLDKKALDAANELKQGINELFNDNTLISDFEKKLHEKVDGTIKKTIKFRLS